MIRSLKETTTNKYNLIDRKTVQARGKVKPTSYASMIVNLNNKFARDADSTRENLWTGSAFFKRVYNKQKARTYVKTYEWVKSQYNKTYNVPFSEMEDWLGEPLLNDDILSLKVTSYNGIATSAPIELNLAPAITEVILSGLSKYYIHSLYEVFFWGAYGFYENGKSKVEIYKPGVSATDGNFSLSVAGSSFNFNSKVMVN